MRRSHCVLAVGLALAAALAGCASPEQMRSDARELLQERTANMARPQTLASEYTTALEAFGRLLAVYRGNGKPIYVQTRSITDATGLSHPLVGSELPNDITEMIRSAVNRIGDGVIYVPFHPDYVLAHERQGARLQLTLPDVLITGAITEFDRALASAGKGLDATVIFGKGKGETDTSFNRKATATISRLTLDFNLVDFERQVMVPKMQAVNSMQVLNDTLENSFDFAIYGNGFGLTSNTRYLQGRHNAIRLLVDLSVLQLLGRYANVPYWRCIPGAAPDTGVLERVRRNYAANDRDKRVKWLRETLRDYGFPLAADGPLDTATKAALDILIEKFNWPRPTDHLDPQLFEHLFVNIPLPVKPRGARIGAPRAALAHVPPA